MSTKDTNPVARVRAGESTPVANAFGAFGGVFTPSILTILGVIMFMRTGFVVGQAGILAAVGILFAAKAITLLTSLSISAISTNTRVEGGGAYFMISRSLGPASGGSIGLALFLAQAFSVPFYILGLVEAMSHAWPAIADQFMWIGLGVATVLFVICQIGASWAIRAQYAILTVMALSVVVFLGGAVLDFDVAVLEANLKPEYTEPRFGFWVMFAIFFPAVTGIMAGVNMSGDLKEPERAIPLGTLAAVGVGCLIYMLQIVLTGGAFDRAELVETPYQSLLDHALFGFDWIVVAGVFAATMSSALGSFLGAPRILQALARDDIFPGFGFFAKGSPKGDEPKRGSWLTYGMTILVLVYAGNDEGGVALNMVAAVLTMFFLYTYGMTNMAAFVEHFSRNPSFRPRFRAFHWTTALAGALGCLLAAVLVNAVAAVGAFAIIVLVYVFVQRRVLETTFGDSLRGFFYARARSNLIKLAAEAQHPKNWRPTTLVLSGNPAHRQTLTSYAEWLESGRGIVTLAQVIVGDVDEHIGEADEARKQLEAHIQDKGLTAFPEVVVAPNFDDGVATMVQSHSIGPLKPNLVVLGWPSSSGRAAAFARHLRLINRLGRSIVCVIDRGLPDKRPERIDIWWRGADNGSLMVILGYLLTLSWQWRRATLRILRMIPPDGDADEALAEIQGLIDAARIHAQPRIVRGTRLRKTIVTESSDASVVFLGFRPPSDENAAATWDALLALTVGLPTTLFVSSSGEADLLA